MNEDSSPSITITDSPQKTTLGGVDFHSPLVRSALLCSLFDGLFSSVMFGLVETFAVAAALKVKAPPMAIAVMGSLPMLAASVFQVLLPLIVNPGRQRKYYVVRSIVLQAFFIACAGLTGLLPHPWNAAGFIAAYVLYGFSGQSMGTLWMAWMGDLIPEQVRGRHFAWRNRFFSLISLVFSLSIGLFARKLTADTTPWIFFGAIFSTASLFRIGSFFAMRMQYDPPAKIQRATSISFRLSRRFLAFAFTTALFQGAANFSGPFFSVWFLRDLKFDYLTFAIVGAFGTIGTIVTLPIWGRLIDRLGTRAVFQISGFMAAVIPIPYLFISAPWAIWITNCYSGIAWSGFNISNFSYLLHISGREKSERVISISVALTGVTIFIFSLLGGWCATHVPTIFKWQLQTLFLISCILRLIAMFSFRLLTNYQDRTGEESGRATQMLEILPKSKNA